MADPVVHFEIDSKMPEQLRSFYAALFGWKVDANNPMNYGMVDTQAGRGINGGIGSAQDFPNMVTWYVGVPDIDASLKKIESLGGKTIMPKMDAGGMVTIGMFSDPEGNAVGLVQIDPDAPADGGAPSPGDGAAVTHFEVLGKDGKALQRFYADAFGWDLQDVGGSAPYGIVQPVGGVGTGGGVGASDDEAMVTFYVESSDLDATLRKVAELGGKTVLEPKNVMDQVDIAMFADPEGNIVGLARSTA